MRKSDERIVKALIVNAGIRKFELKDEVRLSWSE